MDLLKVNEVVQSAFLNSASFPYRTGNLKDNFFDANGAMQIDNTLQVGILSSSNLIKGRKRVNYGKLLQVKPYIKYRKREKILGFIPTHIRHKNKHFRYIDNIIESDVVGAIEREFGVKRV